jgi:hypothetical protein
MLHCFSFFASVELFIASLIYFKPALSASLNQFEASVNCFIASSLYKFASIALLLQQKNVKAS